FSRLASNCRPLDECCDQIVVGLQTSADFIYHLERVSRGFYRRSGQNADGKVHAIEDGIMRPLVSGPEAKRYQRPTIETYILFPYVIDTGGARLYTDDEIQRLFPNAWSYLKLYEDKLRERESGAMDIDGSWWAYGRNQSLNIQEKCKLCVAQTVKKLEIFFDSGGEFYINNVRVNGILVDSEATGWFLLGVLNTPASDFMFRRISIPKDNGYFEANKQYIAPLPIPTANEDQRKQVGAWAKELQTLTTERRDLVAQIQSR
ncbi:MAG: restriction endonuclease subunit M, partial [Desulfomonilaceae bacterium]